MREKETNKYENAHIQAVAIKFSRKQDREPSPSSMFARLNVFDYKKARQNTRQSVIINQSCVKLRV